MRFKSEFIYSSAFYFIWLYFHLLYEGILYITQLRNVLEISFSIRECAVNYSTIYLEWITVDGNQFYYYHLMKIHLKKQLGLHDLLWFIETFCKNLIGDCLPFDDKFYNAPSAVINTKKKIIFFSCVMKLFLEDK